MFRFLTRQHFIVNLIVALLLAAAIVFGILQLLGVITQHGQYLTVPYVLNKNTQDAIKLLESKGFDVEIQDSTYVDTAKMGVVLKQFPDPNSTVKINRTVLLTVNRVTLPLIDVPALQGKSMNYAIELLERSHLKLGDTTFKPDFMVGSVLQQLYNGNPVQPGAKVPYGSKIDLVVGGGLSDQRVPIPDLVGKSFAEAKLTLEGLGIVMGIPVASGNITDTLSAFVYRQSPETTTELVDGGRQTNYIQSGQIMDLWISQQMIYSKDTTSNPKKPKNTNDE